MTAETKAKISAALKGRSHPHKGHPMSAASRAKISAALRGKHHAGHPMSAATRAKISASLKARHHTTARPKTTSTRHKAAAKRPATPRRHQISSGAAKQPRTVRHGMPSGRRFHAVGVHKSVFSKISSGAGYHHTYTGYLRPKRAGRSSKIRITSRHRAHRVWGRRKR